MRKRATLFATLFSFVLLLAVGLSMAANGTTSAHTKAESSHAATSKSTAKSHAESSAKTSASAALAPAENLSGTISSVSPSDHVVTLMGANGVPYDFRVTDHTRIEAANEKLPMSDLASESHKQATIHFVPEANGNRAEAIRIS